MQAFRRHVRKAVTRRRDDARRPLQLPLHIAGDKLLDDLPAELRRQRALGHLLAAAADGEHLRRIVEIGFERREPLIPHQHQEIDLRQIARIVRVETARAVFDGISAVAGDGLPGF